MENRNGSAKVTSCLPLLKSARPICSAARRSWRNTFSPSVRAISALVSRAGSKSGKANHRTRWRKRWSLRFSREFWREKPEKFSFFGLRIDIEQSDAGFGKFERSARQSGNDVGKVWFVTHQHQSFRAMPLEYGSQLAHSKAGREQFILPQLRFQIIGCDLGSLRCARQRAGHDQIGSHLETREKFRHIAHFFFTEIGERTLIIRFFPIGPIGLTMAKEIKLHVDLYALLHDSPLRSAGSRVDLPKSNATKKSVSVMS